MKIELDNARKIYGDFRIAPSAALDPDIYEKVREYKEKIAARFISIGEEDVGQLPGSRFYISRKLDGEHNHLYFEDGQATFIKPGGASIHGLPVLEEAAAVLTKAGVKSCVIPGELIVEKPNTSGGHERTRIYDVIRLLTYASSDEELSYFNFAPFDILELDGVAPESYEAALQRLKELFAGSRIQPVETVVSGDRETILKYYEEWVKAEGDEGLMIRSDLPFRYKFKAAHRFDAAVIGYREREGQISGLLLGLMFPNGLFQILGTVSDGIESKERGQLEARLRGREINSEYIHVDNYHSSYRMVRPEVVVEINSDDILTKHVDGRPYRKMVLEYVDEDYRTYKPVRSAAFVGLQRNTFIRFRDDKKVNPTDVRVAQVTDLVVIDAGVSADFRRANLPAAQVLLREVYNRADAKSGAFAVRKIVAWKTNKETADPAYSAYVVHFTDFSPVRAEPLQRELILTDDVAQIDELVAVYRERCTLRGWQLYSDQVPVAKPAPTPQPNKSLLKKAKQLANKPSKKATSQKQATAGTKKIAKKKTSKKAVAKKKSAVKKKTAVSAKKVAKQKTAKTIGQKSGINKTASAKKARSAAKKTRRRA